MKPALPLDQRPENPGTIQLADHLLPLLKTSHSHPLQVSWILPPSMQTSIPKSTTAYLQEFTKAKSSVVPNEKRKVSNDHEYDDYKDEDDDDESDQDHNVSQQHRIGNLALCSAPGKKIRLNGNGISKSRLPISRDLETDFARIKALGIDTIVNLLDDKELEYLNAPWTAYNEKAVKAGLEVIRYPIVEGYGPDALTDFHDKVIIPLTKKIYRGENVIVHCRGGIGRAGLVACCFLLFNKLCKNADRAITLVRSRRSPKAIETAMQEEYIQMYHEYVQRLDAEQHVVEDKPRGSITTEEKDELEVAPSSAIPNKRIIRHQKH